MKKLYLLIVYCLVISLTSFLPKIGFSQSCTSLTATYITNESRCAATGSVQINATGGSGNYEYKASGPVVTNFTSSSLITGLSAGRYLIIIKDVIANCIYDQDSITIAGDYAAPNFTMVSTDVTCINGNDGTITVTGQSFGRAPFSYQIVAPSASGIGIISLSGNFTGLISGNYLIQLTDSCGAIQTRGIAVQNYDWFINNYPVTKVGCDSISVTINLKDIKGKVTPDSVFNGFLYGASVTDGDTTWFTTNTFNYYIGNKHSVKFFVKDKCGNIKSVIWTDPYKPNVNAAVAITNKACSTFTATITGQVNLTNPEYCIYTDTHTLIECNTTGVFNLLPYGSYCIEIRDNCYDTTISRCFTVTTPVPSVNPNVIITTTCKGFTVNITGKTNLTNAYYCLYDSSDVLLYCDSTGVFTNLPFGRYCIKIFNDPACYDTTITRCFTVSRPVPGVGPNITITNLTCSTFTAIVADTSNLNNAQYCLFTPDHVLIICNSTGVFDNLPYGSYCIDIINNPSCYDTTITRCFTVNRPIPSVGASVSISNKNCAGFTATITGKQNLNNPQFCIYNSLNILLGCNTTGIFTSLPYGNYCITIRNDSTCYDTLITRCFNVKPPKTDISLTAKKSCTILGTSNLKVDINSGIPVFTVSLYSPAGVLLQSVFTSSSSYTFNNMPGLPVPLKYKIVVRDQCGNLDSLEIAPVISIVDRVITISPKCPTGIWPNGSADVLVNITNNNIGGDITPKIIKKNGLPVSINASLSSGYNFTFLNLEPATFIFDTYINDCNKHVYDTIVVRPYIFPVLSGSNAYQCDNNSFSVSVNVSGGIAPYTYEIIGSVPASPSIVTAPQASPNFNINNGTIYSLIRLRVVDGCGNASLYDLSVLPLANFIVFWDTVECFNHSLTLRVDSIANAQYTWYKRIVPNDSIVVGTGTSLYFPNLLPSDTGRYFCRIVVNNGCMIRYANYILTGFCNMVLPVDVTLTGVRKEQGNLLYWNTGGKETKEFSVQKKLDNTVDYKTINNIMAAAGISSYYYLDRDPFAGYNYYRLKITTLDNTIKYTNVILINNFKSDISIYPNPVNDMLFISIKSNTLKNYLVEIKSITGQKISSATYSNTQNLRIQYPRNNLMQRGVYLLTITDLVSKERQTFKLIYN
ncbi:T9SS type A sorting domain-containing protein [Ferruginibacter sp.]|nr:T9SS type A sorting domain-containing protein [Ferruginibacter sp.]